MAVNIHANQWQAVGDAEHNGAFRGPRRESEQRFPVAWQHAAEFRDHAPSNGVDLPGLGFVNELARMAASISWVIRANSGRRTRLLKQLPGGRQRYLVVRADRDEAGHELAERRREAVLGQAEQGCLGKGVTARSMRRRATWILKGRLASGRLAGFMALFERLELLAAEHRGRDLELEDFVGPLVNAANWPYVLDMPARPIERGPAAAAENLHGAVGRVPGGVGADILVG